MHPDAKQKERSDKAGTLVRGWRFLEFDVEREAEAAVHLVVGGCEIVVGLLAVVIPEGARADGFVEIIGGGEAEALQVVVAAAGREGVVLVIRILKTVKGLDDEMPRQLPGEGEAGD